MRVKVYRSNQRHAELKAKERREAEAAAAAAHASITLDHPLSDSDLTDFDSHDDLPSLVHAIKFTQDDSRAKLQEMLKEDEFNLRKRKVATDSPSKSIKRPRKSTVPVEPAEPVEPVEPIESVEPAAHGYVQNISTWTTDPENIDVASPARLNNGHELLVAAASGRSHGFVSVNNTEHNVQPMPPVQSASYEDPSVSESALNPSVSNASSPNNDTQHLPETPGEGVLMHTQYSLPQEVPQSEEIAKSAQHLHPDGYQQIAGVSAQPSSQPQPSDKFIPWPKISKRRAKRSKTALRPMLDHDDMELSVQDGVPPAPATPAAPVEDNENTDSRKLMRRTHVRTPVAAAAAEPTQRATSSVPTSIPVSTFTPVSTQKRTYQTPYADAHPPLPTPQSASTSVDAILGAANPHPVTMPSPLVASASTTINNNNHTPPSADMPLSAQLITAHFAQTFVKFTLPLPNGRSANKMIKLTDCSDAFALHRAVINRFKHALAGQIPSEIVFTSANEDYEIEADECGQHTWNEFMQTVIETTPPGTCPIVALVRI